MATDIVKLLAEVLFMVCCFLFGKYLGSNNTVVTEVTETIADAISKMDFIVKYADMFVAWARQFMQDKTGKEKMEEVVEQLSIIAERYGIDMTETEIQAIAQKSYDSMKNGEAAATTPSTIVVSSDTINSTTTQ